MCMYIYKMHACPRERQLITCITPTSAGSPDLLFYSWFDLLEKGNLNSLQEEPPQPLFP